MKTMKKFLSLFVLICFVNATVYPYTNMGKTSSYSKKGVHKPYHSKRWRRHRHIHTQNIAISRSADSINLLWDAEAFPGVKYFEITRHPGFANGSQLVEVKKGSYVDKEVVDGTEYRYMVFKIEGKNKKKLIATLSAYFGSKTGTALAGRPSRVNYDGLVLVFQGTEFTTDTGVTIRISPDDVEEDLIIQASDIYEITTENDAQPLTPVTAEISYNTINMPQGYTEGDLRVFIRHDAKSPWELAKIIRVDRSRNIIYASIPHFSEIVAGFSAAPESSQTRANVNTALPKINLPDPFIGKMKVSLPQPNIYGVLNQGIPIQLPAGKAGMTPEISLVYNSAQKNGLLGYGWALSAGDSISYVKKNGNYVYTCSDGELVLTSQSGSIYNYHLKYEKNYVRYEYDSYSDTWSVIKDGYTFYYGENGAKLSNNLPGMNSRQWLLTSKVSPDSIAIHYNYIPTYGNELILDSITYDHFKIQMVWEDRNDIFSYTSGVGYYTMKQRLAGIQIQSTLNKYGTYQLEREYILTYTNSDVGDSLLSKVELKYSDGTPLSQIDMTYKINDFIHSINTNAQSWNTNSPISEDRQRLIPMDINGDGLQDIVTVMDGITNISYGKFKVYTNSGHGFIAMPALWNINDGFSNINDFPMERIRFRDMNDDGRPDIVANFTAYPSGERQATWKVFINTNNSFVYDPEYTLSLDVDPGRFSMMDINGDGRSDFIINRTGLEGYTGIVYEVYTNRITGIESSPVYWQYPVTTDPAMVSTLDVTGDGLVDLLVRNDSDTTTGWKVFRNTGSGFDTTPLLFSISKTDPQFISWMDINGDGMQEIVVNTNNGSNQILSVYRNNGSSILTNAETWIAPSANPYEISFQDMNGDGRPDIVINRQDVTIKLDIWLNTGNGFVSKGTIDLQGTDPSILSFIDINGNGAVDSVINNPDGSFTVYDGKQNFNYLLSSIEANHMVIEYDYDNANNGLGFPRTVLKKTTVRNKLPETDPGYFSKDTFYIYEQGRYDRQNRIMYGFGKITASDVMSNKSIVYYSQDGEEMIGRVLTNESYAGTNSVLVSLSINNYTKQNMYGGKSKIVLLTDSVNVTWALDQTESLATKTEYKYYGLDYISGGDADGYYLLYKKINLRKVTGSDFSINPDTTDDIYQEYKYTTANDFYNITPKLCSSESYMIRADMSKDKLGETQYYFVGAPSFGTIGDRDLVALKKEWNGTNEGGNKWLTTLNRYDTADRWRLVGTTLSNEKAEGSTLIKTTDYSYDTTLRFITETSNTYDMIVETSKSLPEPVWGLPLKVIDNNNQTNYYRYDKLNRLLAVYKPGDNFAGGQQTGLNSISDFTNNISDTASVLYVYGEGNANTMFTKALTRLKRNDTSPVAFIESIAFIDGMGRTLQTKISHKNPATGGKYYVVSGKQVYDRLDRVIETHEPIRTDEPLETYYLYGNSVKNPVITTYDELDRVIRTDKGTGEKKITFRTEYIGLYKTVFYDAEGNISETIKDEYGRVKKIIDYVNKERLPANVYATIDYAYDSRGNLTNTVDINGNCISVAYDELNRKIAMSDPDMGNWTYEYDDLGRLITTTDAKGQKSRNEYDAAGRLILKTYDGGTAPAVSYMYGTSPEQNNNGRLIGVNDGSGSESYYYNERGELIEIIKFIDGVKYVSSFSYDALGRVDTIVYPHPSGASMEDIIKLKYTYEEYSGLLDKIDRIDAETGEIIKPYLKNIDYDVMGRRTAVTYGNDVTTTYTYDDVKSLLQNCTIARGESTLKEINYNFDKMGNLLVKDETEARTEYQYDNLYRLTQAVFTPKSGSGLEGTGYTQQNAYDPLGNILSKDVDPVNSKPGNRNYQYSSGKPHAVTGFTGTYKNDENAVYSFEYDANGNMTEQRITYQDDGTKTAVKRFTWDGANRLRSLSWEGSTWRYYYDHTGERIKKVKNEGTPAEDATIYVNGIAQFRAGSEVYAVFDGVNRIAVISRVAEENTFYLNTDHIGSTALVTREDGAVYRKIIYRSFGEIYKAWDEASGWHTPDSNILSDIGNYAFTGQEIDSETGLYYYGARYYDPNIGRFISADTKIDGRGLDTQGYNRYAYCRNNPITYSDPSGHDWWSDFCNWLGDTGKAIVSVVATVVMNVVGIASWVITGGAIGWVGYVWWQGDVIQGGVLFGGTCGVIGWTTFAMNSRTGQGYLNISIYGSATFDFSSPGMQDSTQPVTEPQPASEPPVNTPGTITERNEDSGVISDTVSESDDSKLVVNEFKPVQFEYMHLSADMSDKTKAPEPKAGKDKDTLDTVHEVGDTASYVTSGLSATTYAVGKASKEISRINTLKWLFDMRDFNDAVAINMATKTTMGITTTAGRYISWVGTGISVSLITVDTIKFRSGEMSGLEYTYRTIGNVLTAIPTYHPLILIPNAIGVGMSISAGFIFSKPTSLPMTPHPWITDEY